MKVIYTVNILSFCLIYLSCVKLPIRSDNLGNEMLNNYALFAESLYANNNHETIPFSEEKIDEESRSLSMNYDELMDVFHNNQQADKLEEKKRPDQFKKLNNKLITDESFTKKNNFMKSFDAPKMNFRMSFKQNEKNKNQRDRELISEIKSSLTSFN